MKFFVSRAVLFFSAVYLPIGRSATYRPEGDVDFHDATVADRHHLQTPYTHDQFENEDWDFGGNTVVHVYDCVRLTSDRPSQSGWIWSKTQLEADAWSVEFEFRIHGSNPSMHGDGFAFWYSVDPFVPGQVFGYKDQFTGLAVIFDTYGNGPHEHSFPYISAMLGDGQLKYDHDNDNKASILGQGCEANIRGSDEPLKARVTYFKNKVLELEFKDGEQEGWQRCFALQSNITLPAKGYIGFTAASGDAHDIHDLISVSTFTHNMKSGYVGEGAGATAGTVVTGSNMSAAGMLYAAFLFLVKAGAVLAVVATAVYAYRSRADKSQKLI